MPAQAQIEETGIAPALRTFIATGGAAGAIVVTGITPSDRLAFVLNLTDAVDLTSEFTISDDDEIDNAGGTATTGDSLWVGWWRSSTE